MCAVYMHLIYGRLFENYVFLTSILPYNLSKRGWWDALLKVLKYLQV